MCLTEDDKTYLAHKHQGGVNNQKGNSYECLYAVVEIIRLFASAESIDDCWVKAQLEGAFVDDLAVLDFSGMTSFIQIKDCLKLSWGKGLKGSLLYDFNKQKQLNSARGIYSRLKIVYSNADSDIHKDIVPVQIADVTDKLFFPAFPNLSVLIQEMKEVREYIDKIIEPSCIGKIDCEYQFAQILREAWMELSAPDKTVSLSEIKYHCLKFGKDIPNFNVGTNVYMARELELFLNGFNQVKFKISGDELTCSFAELVISITIDDELISDLIKSSPADEKELILKILDHA